MHIMLGFDGGNASDLACYAYVTWLIDGEKVLVVGSGQGKCHDTLQTNNVAEWSGVMYGLMNVVGVVVTLKRETKIDKLFIHGDSQLVLRQLSGEYSVTREHLKFYYDKCRALVRRIEQEGIQVEIGWVAREQNTFPDRLTHHARMLYLGDEKITVPKI